MDSITFCIPFHQANETHIQLLHTCLKSIRALYPKNPILICRTSTSTVGQLPVEGVEVFQTFKDGSHIFGAMELLVNKCKTEHYILMHDSMLLLRELPAEILEKRLFYLWNFDQGRDHHNFDPLLNDSAMPLQEVQAIKKLYAEGYPKAWTGLFGPAFGGEISTLKTVWAKLNLDATKVERLLGRPGLMISERYLSVILFHMSVVDFFADGRKALNGDIFEQPNAFKGGMDITTPIEELKRRAPKAVMWKTWQFRN